MQRRNNAVNIVLNNGKHNNASLDKMTVVPLHVILHSELSYVIALIVKYITNTFA